MYQRNYATVPQIPTAPGYSTIPINQKISNNPLLPYQLPMPGTAAITVPNPAITTVAGVYPWLVTVPSKSFTEGIPFHVLVSGLTNTPTASIFTLNLTLGLGPAAGVSIASLVAGTATAGLWPFYLETQVIADSTSGRLNGRFRGQLQGAIFQDATITNQTGLNFANNPVMGFGLLVMSSVANANAYIRFNEFAIY